MRFTPSRGARSLVLVALTALVAAACTHAIGGQAAKIASTDGTRSANPPADGPSGPKPGVAPSNIKVTNDGHTDMDTAAKNTITDLYAYYTDVFPKDFQRTFTPAKELISYDSNVRGPSVCGRSLFKEVNASYNPACDTIVWDRGVLLPQLTSKVGPLGAPTVLAHEMGHLVQARLDVPITAATQVILLEQQADCYAGAYWRWVADGHSTYFDLNQTTGFRQVLSAIMATGDPVGVTKSADQAHGSAFDRSFAFALGYANGAVRCNQIDQAEVDRRIQETGFTVLPKNFGNVDVTDKFLGQVATVVNSYFTERVKGYQPPALKSFDGSTGPACGGTPGTFPVSFCAATNTVSYNLKELQRIGTPTAGYDSQNGDFSAVTLLVSRYALAAESTGGAATTGDQAGLRALCYTGSWAGWMRKPQGPEKLQLSPNDLNKAVYEVMSSPLPAADVAGSTSTPVIDQIQALYIGVVSNDVTKCRDFYSG